jgi:AMP-binding enzyme C-terminal domain
MRRQGAIGTIEWSAKRGETELDMSNLALNLAWTARRHEHPAVAQVAVIGIPHDSLGEEVGAAVVLKAEATAKPDELRQYIKERVAAYKYPRRIWFADSLPTGPTGKLLRREVVPPPFEEAQSAW